MILLLLQLLLRFLLLVLLLHHALTTPPYHWSYPHPSIPSPFLYTSPCPYSCLPTLTPALLPLPHAGAAGAGVPPALEEPALLPHHLQRDPQAQRLLLLQPKPGTRQKQNKPQNVKELFVPPDCSMKNQPRTSWLFSSKLPKITKKNHLNNKAENVAWII